MSIDSGPPRKDIWDFLIHGFFGAIVGGFLGYGAYLQFPFPSNQPPFPLWLSIAIGALVLGLVAGIYGDHLWRNLKHWW